MSLSIDKHRNPRVRAVLVQAASVPRPGQAEGAAAPDTVSQASPDTAAPPDWAGKELPVRKIPNVPENAEAYYAPDNLHVIAQTQDEGSQDPGEGRAGGALTYTFTDTGEEITRINDHGQDACSWFFPDGQRLVWTSTRDHMDMPLGNWSDETEYPQGAELYVSDLKCGDIKRLTNNKYYEAEVTTTLDGQWVIFARQIDGKMDAWKMRIDGTDEQQLTFTVRPTGARASRPWRSMAHSTSVLPAANANGVGSIGNGQLPVMYIALGTIISTGKIPVVTSCTR